MLHVLLVNQTPWYSSKGKKKRKIVHICSWAIITSSREMIDITPRKRLTLLQGNNPYRLTIPWRTIWSPAWDCDSQLMPFKVQLGYRHDHKLVRRLKSHLGARPPIDVFQGLAYVSARPEVARRLNSHLGIVTTNWRLSGFSVTPPLYMLHRPSVET